MGMQARKARKSNNKHLRGATAVQGTNRGPGTTTGNSENTWLDKDEANKIPQKAIDEQNNMVVLSYGETEVEKAMEDLRVMLETFRVR